MLLRLVNYGCSCDITKPQPPGQKARVDLPSYGLCTPGVLSGCLSFLTSSNADGHKFPRLRSTTENTSYCAEDTAGEATTSQKSSPGTVLSAEVLLSTKAEPGRCGFLLWGLVKGLFLTWKEITTSQGHKNIIRPKTQFGFNLRINHKILDM